MIQGLLHIPPPQNDAFELKVTIHSCCNIGKHTTCLNTKNCLLHSSIHDMEWWRLCRYETTCTCLSNSTRHRDFRLNRIIETLTQFQGQKIWWNFPCRHIHKPVFLRWVCASIIKWTWIHFVCFFYEGRSYFFWYILSMWHNNALKLKRNMIFI